MATKPKFTTTDPWLEKLNNKVQDLRKAFVLCQYDHVGFTAQELLKEYFSSQTEPALPINQLNGVELQNERLEHEDQLPGSINIYQPYIVPMYRLFPHKYDGSYGHSGQHLSHRHFPLSDDHPAIICVGYIVGAIQNLGYLPESSKPTPEFQKKILKIRSLSDSQRNAYQVYIICKELCQIYGTWVNITPSIMLQCLQYFLTISPVTTYLLTTHLLSAIIYDSNPDPNNTGSRGGSRLPTVIKNVRYRRQLYVYLVQSIAIAARLRFHTLYTPNAFPYRVIEGRGGVKLTEDEIFQISFLNVFIDLTRQQCNLIMNKIHEFTVTEENLAENTNEKAASYPYFPLHIQQHVQSVFQAIDHEQDKFEFSNLEPFSILRLFITGFTSLTPTQLPGMTSVSFLTKPAPVVEFPRDELEQNDGDIIEDDNEYVQKYAKFLRDKLDQYKDNLDTSSDVDHDEKSEDKTEDKAEDKTEQVQNKVIKTTTVVTGNSSPITTTTNATRDVIESLKLSSESPIITAMTTEQPQTREQTTSLTSMILYPVAMIAAGALARHGWSNGVFANIWKSVLKIYGVKRLVNMIKLAFKVLYGK